MKGDDANLETKGDMDNIARANKIAFVLAIALCAADAAGASVMRQSSLPPSGFADTETATNVVFSFAEEIARDFSLVLSLGASPSNCVEVSFGRDADGNGQLAPSEAGLAIGWDCGQWFIVGTNRSARIEASPANGATRKELSMVMCLDSSAGVKQLSIRESGSAEVFPELVAARPGWLFDRSWNLARLVVRGVDPARERAVAVLCGAGTVVRLR